jgi:high-affinity Fe2+/Pb2+ permease
MMISIYWTGVRMKTKRFSLAELILLATVCLGLFALFIPVFYNSRQKSKTTACVDQLGRMLGNSVSNYTAQNDGYLPMW